MYDADLERLLKSTGMAARPDAEAMQAVREHMLLVAQGSVVRTQRRRNVLMVAVLALGVSGIGLAATKNGRSFLRSVFTPVEQAQSAQWWAPDGEVWSRVVTGRTEPLSPKEREEAVRQFAENSASKQLGAGRLVGLIENPGFEGVTDTIYLIEYTQSSGKKNVVGSSRPTGTQGENMRIDEIMALRDAGAGEIIEQAPFPIGMGNYTIRFTLPDGISIDLQTFFPPSTAQEREQIFTEMRQLKTARTFTVLNAQFDSNHPAAGVWGTLQYRLADGRIVGATEQLPADAISEDGTQVVMPDQEVPLPIESSPPE